MTTDQPITPTGRELARVDMEAAELRIEVAEMRRRLAIAREALGHAREAIDAVDSVIPDWAEDESSAMHEAGILVTDALAAIDAASPKKTT